jgi:hypothetical protein
MSSWDVLEGGSGLLAAVSDDSVVAFRDGAELSDPRVNTELEQAGPALVVPGSPEVAGELIACRAAGVVASADGETSFDAPALRWEGHTGREGVVRTISILLEDGGLVAVRTHGSQGAAHGDEVRAAGFTRGSDRQVNVSEVLLSTEFGADGVQRRATLELWPDEDDDDLPCRGAGTLISAATREENGTARTVAFFAWSVGGRAGLGRYEIARPR